MDQFSNFSSWPPAQEQQFVVFEQHNKQSAQKGLMFGTIAGAITLVLAMIVYFGHSPEKKPEAKPEAKDGATLNKGSEPPAPAPK